jgi:hypothetical protein
MSHALDLQGRTAKAHIDKWQQYGEKAKQHATSAALILIEAKKELGHGSYLPWLSEHGIEKRTAQRLVLEHTDPVKRSERQEYQQKQNASAKTVRAAKSDMHGAFEQRPTASTQSSGELQGELSTDEKRKRLVTYVQRAARVAESSGLRVPFGLIGITRLRGTVSSSGKVA